jgi:CRP-like cAMP-binding protein
MEKLIDAIKKYVELTDNDIELINNLFITKKLRKNESFITPGKPCDNFAFIEKGLFKHSIFDSEGQEKVIYFSSDNDFICDYESFISRQPSKKSITALEDTTIIYSTYSNMQVFYSKVSSGERFGRLFLENIFNKTINHIVSMHTDSAEQLYLNFLSMYKDIQNRIPQYYIASFVGVTPQSLSRIRRNLVQK